MRRKGSRVGSGKEKNRGFGKGSRASITGFVQPAPAPRETPFVPVPYPGLAVKAERRRLRQGPYPGRPESKRQKEALSCLCPLV